MLKDLFLSERDTLCDINYIDNQKLTQYACCRDAAGILHKALSVRKLEKHHYRLFIREMKASTSDGRVAQLVTMRMSEIVSPRGPQYSKVKASDNVSMISFGRWKNCWFVGDGMNGG